MSNHAPAQPLRLEHSAVSFVAELATAPTSRTLRERIATSFQLWAKADGVLFLESATDGNYFCTLSVSAKTATLNGRGSLARWLRVNNLVLIVRDQADVLAYLTAEDREFLAACNADACVPLVTGGRLVAILVLCGVSDTSRLKALGAELGQGASRAAEIWRQVARDEELQAQRAALGQSHRLGIAGQLAATVAHEVRNPLAAIRSSVQFARDTPISEDERQSILADVLAEVDRIDQTVKGILQLSQPAAPLQELLDLSNLAESVVRFVRAYGNKQSVSVEVEGGDTGICVRGDERELRQVLTNLLLNGCQACEPGGRVVVSVRLAEVSGRFVEINVRDTGRGIRPDDLHRIFEPFFTTKHQGTGLGLPYSREVAERHGGSISIQSAPGNGTTVRVHLPIQESDELTPDR